MQREKDGKGGERREWRHATRDARKRRGRKRGRVGASHGKKTSLRPEHGVVEGPIGSKCRSNTARVVSMETGILPMGEETRHPWRGGPERRQRGWLGLPSSQVLSFFLPMLRRVRRGPHPLGDGPWGRTAQGKGCAESAPYLPFFHLLSSPPET